MGFIDALSCPNNMQSITVTKTKCSHYSSYVQFLRNENKNSSVCNPNEKKLSA
jgi:hypothetical protein